MKYLLMIFYKYFALIISKLFALKFKPILLLAVAIIYYTGPLQIKLERHVPICSYKKP